jgi:pimeloyl-ACP methyl ester carboxylesterase
MLHSAMGRIEETEVTVDGVRVFCRRVRGEGPPAVFVHGNPTHSGDWIPFLERLSGPAIAPDLPGWGRSDRPRGFDYTMHGLARFADRLLAELGIGEYRLVVHDWGALALIGAQREPSRLRGLVVINAVPLLPGYRWHPIARLWRLRGIGELVNLTGTRRGAALLLRQATADRGPMPDEFVDSIWRHRQRGTARPTLTLYRSADPELLEAAGSRLGELRCPALVVWGARDTYLPPEFGRLYAERLPNAELVELPDAAHWPWLDRRDVVDRVVGFLERG